MEGKKEYLKIEAQLLKEGFISSERWRRLKKLEMSMLRGLKKP